MDVLMDLRRRGNMLLIRLVLKGLDRLPTKRNKLAVTARLGVRAVQLLR